MRIIFLIMIGVSMLHAEFIRDNSKNIVKDTGANLEWQDSEVIYRERWEPALDYCENLELDGTGWRLPNMAELQSIVDFTKSRSPVTFDAFKHGKGSYYWSSTSLNYSYKGHYRHRHYAHTIYFGSGEHGSYLKDDGGSMLYVRCVRDSY